MDIDQLFFLYVSFFSVVGFAVGYFLRLFMSLGRRNSIELEIKQILLNAREEAKNITQDALERAEAARLDAESLTKTSSEKAQALEERLIRKEERLDKREIHLETQEERLKERLVETDSELDELKKERQESRHALESISGLSAEKAKEKLIDDLKHDFEEDLRVRIHKLEAAGEERYQEKAREILSTAIQRMGTSLPPEILSTEIPLTSDKLKGKIIGKEGRNIRTFERKAGVELVIDDTPNTILVSSFDPIRRAIAETALKNLLKDGRIQPTRIESEIERATESVNAIIKEKGDEAAYECGLYNLDSRVVQILGRLHFRTSYGQNVLSHSIEVAHLAGLLAEELDADVYTAKAAGLLHDIGKALTHEVQGSHVEIGKRILEKFSVSEPVITAMQAHHEDYPFESIESKIVQVADSISASRPGARRDSADTFLKRLEELEDIANSFEEVDRAFALEAGREIRVFVHPESVTDIEALDLARSIARKVEDELAYPGEIKVAVIRESRVIEYAR